VCTCSWPNALVVLDEIIITATLWVLPYNKPTSQWRCTYVVLTAEMKLLEQSECGPASPIRHGLRQDDTMSTPTRYAHEVSDLRPREDYDEPWEWSVKQSAQLYIVLNWQVLLLYFSSCNCKHYHIQQQFRYRTGVFKNILYKLIFLVHCFDHSDYI